MTRRAAPVPVRRARRGFTIVEAIAVISVLAALGSIASTLIYTSVSGYRNISTQAQLVEEGSTALERLQTELRKIPLDSTASGTAPLISSVTATSMAWNSNYSLSLSGTQLSLTENGGTSSALLNNVSSLTIQCYDESNTALAASLSGSACNSIRRIAITITLTRDSITTTLRTKVFLRSTMSGGVP